MASTELEKRRRDVLRIAARIRRGWRLRAAARGLCVALSAAIPVALGTGLDAGYPWRLMLLCLSIAVGAAGIVYILYSLLKPLSSVDAALFLERRAPELRDRFISALQLLDDTARGESAGDPTMLCALADEAVAAAGALPASRIFQNRRANSISLALLIPALIAISWISTSGMQRSRLFVASPWTPARERIVLVHITGDAVVPIGGTFAAEAEFASTPQTFPSFVVRREGMPPEEMRMNRVAGKSAYRVSMSRVAGDFEYSVTAGAFRSRFYRVTAVERPHILSLRLHLEYPAYTEMPPETKEENGDIRAPLGTRVRVDVTASSDLGGAWLEFAPGGRIPMSVQGARRVSGGFAVVRNGRYKVRLADRHGFRNADPPVFLVQAAPDAPPEIELLQPIADLKAPKDSSLMLKGAARDDYGITRVTLRWHVLKSNRGGSSLVPVRPAPEALFEFPWDLSRVEAAPGDVVEFSITAADNHRPGPPHTASTPPIRVTLMSRIEDYRAIEADQQQWAEQMADVVRQGGAISDKFKQIQRDVASGALSGGKKDQDNQRVLQRQEQLEREASDLANTAQDLMKRMQNNDLIPPESLEKIAEIQRLMDSIMTKDMKKAIEKLTEALQNLDLSNANPELMEQLADRQRINNALDQTLNRLRRAMAEQKMDMLAKHLDELNNRQQKLLDAAAKLRKKNLNPAERAEADRLGREEQSIRDEIADDLDRIDSLAQDMKTTDPQMSDALRDMAKKARSESLSQNLQSAAQSFKQSSMPNAEAAARKAKDSIAKLSDRMGALKKQYKDRLIASIKRLIRLVLENTLNLTDTQESLMDRTERFRNRSAESLRADEMAPLAADQRFAQSMAHKVATQIAELSTMSNAVPVTLSGEAEMAAGDMDNAVSLANDRRPAEAWGMMRQAYGQLNRVALALVSARNSAGSLPSESEQEALMRRLEELAKSQQSLNNQTMAAGGMPMPQLGDALSALAMQQQIIRQGLKDLSQNMRSVGELGSRMDQIEKDMAEIEQQLAAGKAGDDVRRRQSTVLRRLRDASLSLRRDTDENRRKAQVGASTAPPKPKTIAAPAQKTLPDAARIEAEHQRKETRPKGYDRVIDRYYEDLLR